MQAGDLVRISQCSWMPATADAMEKTARMTLHSAVLNRHQGKIFSPDTLRAKFLATWNDQWKHVKRDGKEYWAGPEAARGFARRVYELLNKYEVRQPFEPYELILGHEKLTGQVAILQREVNRNEIPFVLHAPLRRARDLRVPNYSALADWLAGRQIVEEIDLYLLHQPLIWGESWMDKDINERLTRDWLTKLVSQATDSIPTPGPWCTSCSHPCRRVFDGPDDYRR